MKNNELRMSVLVANALLLAMRVRSGERGGIVSQCRRGCSGPDARPGR